MLRIWEKWEINVLRFTLDQRTLQLPHFIFDIVFKSGSEGVSTQWVTCESWSYAQELQLRGVFVIPS